MNKKFCAQKNGSFFAKKKVCIIDAGSSRTYQFQISLADLVSVLKWLIVCPGHPPNYPVSELESCERITESVCESLCVSQGSGSLSGFCGRYICLGVKNRNLGGLTFVTG